MHSWKDYDTARVIFEDFKQTIYPMWPNEHTEYENAFEDYIAKQVSTMVTPAEDECNTCWLNTTYKWTTMDCMCNHTECICLDKDQVCPNCKFPYEMVMGRYKRCACSFEPVIAEAEDRDIYELGEIVKNIDDTCQNWYIRRWIPEAIKLIHKILILK